MYDEGDNIVLSFEVWLKGTICHAYLTDQNYDIVQANILGTWITGTSWYCFIRLEFFEKYIGLSSMT